MFNKSNKNNFSLLKSESYNKKSSRLIKSLTNNRNYVPTE